MIAYPPTVPHFSTLYNKWGLRLLEDYVFSNVNGGIHTVPAGFFYDAGSIPAAFWQLTFDPYHPVMQISALPHDWAYISHCMSKKDADETLQSTLLKLKTHPLKASAIKSAVAVFGDSSWNRDNIDYLYLQQLRHDILDSGRSLAKHGL